MPFIKQERRDIIERLGIDALKESPERIQPGDRCYYYYRGMVKQWKANPRWTTAHEIFKRMMFSYGITSHPSTDEQAEWDAAHLLAWQVFFVRYVLPYEDEKEKENGTI